METPRWMKPEWLASQRRKLEAERDRLRDEIDRETRLLGTMGTTSPREPGDIAEEDREDFEVASTLEVAQTFLKEVEEALKRMDGGTYGRCADCGGWISQERLSAMPSAIRCVPCQEAFEKAGERTSNLLNP